MNDEMGGPCGQRSAIAPTLWCTKHDSRWLPRTNYCDDYDDALGLAQEVDAQARADERERCKQEVEATAKWCREDERDAIANAISDLRDTYDDSEWEYRGAYANAIQIARNGGSDD